MGLLRQLICITVDLRRTDASPAVTLLPAVLLEDCIEALPISEVEPVWAVFEEKRDDIVTPSNMDKLKIPMLRIATQLLKRLSRTQQTVLLGRVLIALAVIFPLTDRSGVNLHGNFDTENVTKYDGREDDEGSTEDLDLG